MCIGSLWMPRDGDHAAGLTPACRDGAGSRRSRAGPAQRARGPNVACTGAHSGASAARCSSSQVSTSPRAGAARSPHSSSSVASTSTSHGPSSVVACSKRPRSGGRVAGAAPHEQRARPVVERDAHADAALDRLGLDAAAGAGERLPQLGLAGHAGDDELHRARARAGIEAVADALDPRVPVVRVVGRRPRPRWRAGRRRGRTARRARRRGAAASGPERCTTRGHVRERLAERRPASRRARAAPEAKRAASSATAPSSSPRRARRAAAPTAISVPPASTNSVSRRAVAASSTSHPGQHDRAVRLVRGRAARRRRPTRPRRCRRRARRSRARAG